MMDKKIIQITNSAISRRVTYERAEQSIAKRMIKFYESDWQAAERGDFFPLWGTCLGFQLFATITAGRRIRTVTKTRNMILPLNFLPG